MVKKEPKAAAAKASPRVSSRKANPKALQAKKPERRQFLSYMTPKLIIELKLAAIEEGRPAYELAEEAVAAFLKARKKK